jgi:hypothetical protein
MRILFRKYKYSWFIICCIAAIMAILACNLWSLYWGHCVINDFLRVPLIGWALIGANLVAGIVFFSVKCRKHTKHEGSFCALCHVGLRDAWVYCPNCGNEQHA